MPNKRIILNERDFSTLRLLVDPHTAEQVRVRSSTFSKSFSKVEHVRRRLRELQQNGLVEHFPYFCVREQYYKLSRLGYQMLFPTTKLPHSRFFGAISYGNQPHTFGVIQSLSLLDRLFWLGGHRLEHISTEPYLQTVGDGDVTRIRPDAEFSVEIDQKTLRYFFEYDRGTEPVCTRRDRESLSRKVTRYLEYSNRVSDLFKVVMVFESELRLEHFMSLVQRSLENPNGKTLFYATTIDELRVARSVSDINMVDHNNHQWTFSESRQPRNFRKSPIPLAPLACR